MKRVNIGVVLIILAFVGIIVYGIIEEKTKEEDRVYGYEFVKEYFKCYNKYSLLNEEDRDIQKDADEKRYNEYVNAMKNDLSKYVLEQSQERIFNIYEERLKNQAQGKYMMYKYNKEITDIGKYNISGDYISYILEIKVDVDKDKRNSEVLDKETNRYIGSIKRQKGMDRSYEIVCIKKVGKKDYRVVYHFIVDPDTYLFEIGEENSLWLVK